jgi:Zn-dependent peptidase ImmA (M78 family)
MLTGKLVLAAALAFATARRPALVPEVAVADLADTAMAEMTATGPVIFYNPALYRAAGAAREFVRAHEYGHVLLGHLTDEVMLTTDEGRARAEAQADCFAARAVSPEATLAMADLVRGLPPDPRDRIYGTKSERARRILACAAGAGL